MEYTRYEKARIIAARSLMITLGAPILIKVPGETIDPVKIAMLEYKEDLIPMTISR